MSIWKKKFMKNVKSVKVEGNKVSVKGKMTDSQCRDFAMDLMKAVKDQFKTDCIHWNDNWGSCDNCQMPPIEVDVGVGIMTEGRENCIDCPDYTKR